MTKQILSIGTKLQNEYGTWIVTNITYHNNSYWYDIRGDRGEIILFPSEIKFYTILK